jgi:hypothetical protein
MPKFRKKPVEIEAIRFTKENFGEIFVFTNGLAHTNNRERRIVGYDLCIIPTLEGEMVATIGDWIIKGVNGEFYPCKPDIFQKTYERV